MTDQVAIHETAIVDPDAQLGTGVTVGPYSIIGPDVVLGDRCEIGPHVVIDGHTVMGEENRVFPYAIIGTEPQDQKFKGEITRVEVGDRNVVREFALIKAGTGEGGWVTRIGSDNLLMANAHIAHDCILGDNIVIANNAGLAGHVVVEDYAVIGGLAGVHQFVRIGRYSITGGASMVVMDVPPYCMVAGNRARMYGLNMVALERRGFSDDDIAALKAAHRTIFRSKLTFQEAMTRLQEQPERNPHVQYLMDFLGSSERGFCR